MMQDTPEDKIPGLKPIETDTFEYPEEEATEPVGEISLQESVATATELASLEAASQSQKKQEQKQRRGSMSWHDEVRAETWRYHQECALNFRFHTARYATMPMYVCMYACILLRRLTTRLYPRDGSRSCR